MIFYFFYCYLLGFLAFKMSIIWTRKTVECKKLALFTKTLTSEVQLDAPENNCWSLKKF
jgi:hypothetical protein